MKRKYTALFLACIMLFSISGLNGLNLVSHAVTPEGFAGGTGTAEEPWQIATATQLDIVRNYLGPGNTDKHFMLVDNIDLKAYGAEYDDGKGWQPIGDYSNPFTGTFNGNGKTISGLYINREATNGVGLFGYSSTQYISSAAVINVTLLNASVKGLSFVGSLVGVNYGTIDNSDATGVITGWNSIGGLIGENRTNSIVRNSFAMATVTGNSNIGGLEGTNYGTIEKSYATGNVSGFSTLGGLVGHNSGTIQESHAIGDVMGDQNAGGLVGINAGSIEKAYASGNITCGYYVGGLVGVNNSTINKSYAVGAVSGIRKVGGLAGSNNSPGSITGSYAAGLVTATGDATYTGDYAGGLVAENSGSIVDSYAWGGRYRL